MFLARTVSAGIICFLLVACSGGVSNISSSGGSSMYPIDAEAADRVMATAITQQFPGKAIAPVTLPNPGYSAEIMFVLDRHTITVTALSTKGKKFDGITVDGFAFDVSHHGTMPISGSTAAQGLFDRVQALARQEAAPLPLARM
jgi:hypothetical protein